jgi:hypothetical protein
MNNGKRKNFSAMMLALKQIFTRNALLSDGSNQPQTRETIGKMQNLYSPNSNQQKPTQTQNNRYS